MTWLGYSSGKHFLVYARTLGEIEFSSKCGDGDYSYVGAISTDMKLISRILIMKKKSIFSSLKGPTKRNLQNLCFIYKSKAQMLWKSK